MTIDPIAYLSQYLRDHCQESISLADMSRITGFSEFHLQRKFKAALGVSPKQFQAKCRLDVLKLSLRQAGKQANSTFESTVTDSIYAAGYGSASRVYERANEELGMTPTQYKACGKNVAISYVALTTELGQLLLAATDRGLCFLQMGDHVRTLVQELAAEFPAATLDEVQHPLPAALQGWHAAICAYLAKEAAPTNSSPLNTLPLDIQATAFQARVWNYLRTIPAGQTRSYAEVADAIGAPTATRAVARACAANRVALAIPCHRVIRQNGELGGYRWGMERKRVLLRAESAANNAS